MRFSSMCLRTGLRQALALLVVVMFAFSPAAQVLVPSAQAQPLPMPAGSNSSDDGCVLHSAHGDIKHVIYIQFDNVHFTRDNPNVPSDLEQIPNLLNFLTDNGTFSDNEHTPLKSHTADDIITSLTGVYGDRHGQPIANDFDYFDPKGIPHFTSSFEYWTDIVSTKNDDRPYMITPSGKTAPAPWVPFTRAGCNVGAVSTANMEFENVFGDIATAFANDPAKLMRAQNEVKSNFDGAVADYEGITIHCAASSAVCSAANNGVADVLSQEPGGYNGFNALYGNFYVAPVISPGGPLKDLDGVVISDTDNPPNVGFPGFDPSAAQSLAYVAAMQEHGVPVTFAYMADVHDNHDFDWINAPAECLTDPEQGALGSGNECYEAQLAAYNEAFGKFFARLKADGIDKNNTLFIITADEGDHFAGGPPSPANCTGQNGNFCSYAKLGEIDSNMQTLINTFDPNTVSQSFDIQFDDAPVFYLNGQPAVGSAIAREFERDAAKLTAVSPITGNTDQLTVALSDPVDLKLLHMLTGDPQRDPTFVMWGNPDWFFELGGPTANENPGFAWNHGSITPEVVTTWLGFVGPGVKSEGIRHDVWSDHTDIRPTILLLTGLKDDYQSEGRSLVEFLHHWAIPDAIQDSGDEFVELARHFKKINAPNQELGRTSIRISTRALASGSPGDDSTYINLENQLSDITLLRDDLAARMSDKLDGAEFHGQRISEGEERALDLEAEGLLDIIRALDHQ